MDKAIGGEAHALILDLEDGITRATAAGARRHVAAFLARPDRDRPVAVRVEPSSLREDLAVAIAGGADLVYLPKADLDALAALDTLDAAPSPPPVVALIETAQGLLDAPAVARHPRVVGLGLGESDLCAELGIEASPEILTPLRLQVVVASAAGGLRAPTAPASTDYRDLDAFRRSCVELRRTGFGARSAVHPAQVAVINDVFAPDAAEVARARDLVTRFEAAVEEGRGVIVDDAGRMVDAAVVRDARRLLDEHERTT